jgi:hypothetical protein
MADLEKTHITLGKFLLVLVFVLGSVVPAALAVGHYVQKIDDHETRLTRLESIAIQHEQLQRDTLVLLGRLEERLGGIEKKLK